MSENTFWAFIWSLIAIVVLGFFAAITYVTINHNKTVNEQFGKCIAEGMQHINGNCVVGVKK